MQLTQRTSHKFFGSLVPRDRVRVLEWTRPEIRVANEGVKLNLFSEVGYHPIYRR